MSFIMMIVGTGFFWIQKKDEEVKNFIYTLIGLRNEDDSFDAGEYYKYKRNADTIEDLVARKFINLKDETFRKKISRMEASFKITLGYVNLYSIFQLKFIYSLSSNFILSYTLSLIDNQSLSFIFNSKLMLIYPSLFIKVFESL